VSKVAQVLKVAQNKDAQHKQNRGVYMTKVKKVAVIRARLVENPEAYEGKTNADIEKEILAEIGIIPYVARIEKVTVLDH
jgi:urease gamma subunit